MRGNNKARVKNDEFVNNTIPFGIYNKIFIFLMHKTTHHEKNHYLFIFFLFLSDGFFSTSFDGHDTLVVRSDGANSIQQTTDKDILLQDIQTQMIIR